jgi:5'-3' exonuclease
MGIVSFYGEYLADVRYPRVHADTIPGTVLSLSLDMNGIFHQSAQVVYAYGENADRERARLVATADPQHLEVEYFQMIAQRLGEIISTIKPTLFLTLAVDGVAPLAKISQQRGRRYKSSHTSKTPNLGVSLGSPVHQVFDPNCITPGTALMSRLDNYLQRWIATNRNSLPDRIIYSNHLVRGEGEHKIFEFIRQGLLQTDELGAHVIYGLDADLVMLSSLSQMKWLYLCRENFNDVINIAAFKVGIIEDLSVKGLNSLDSDVAIQDFVLMLYLIGNDFLPHVTAFHHVGSSIDVMFGIYQDLKLPLTATDGQIQWAHFAKFISVLALREPALLHQVASKDYKYPSAAIDSATVKTRGPEGTKVDFDYDKFRLAWYRSAIIPRTASGIELCRFLNLPELAASDIHHMCLEYMKGLQWILRYYTQGTNSASRKYVYRYNHAPLLRDLSLMIQYCVDTNATPMVSDIEAHISDPVFSPIHQLLAVMPPSSLDLIPEKFQVLVQGGLLTDLCPSEFIVEMEGVNKDWQGIAILPHLDPNRVIEAVDTITYGLRPPEYEDQQNIIIENINKSIPRFRGSYPSGLLNNGGGPNRGRGTPYMGRGRGRGQNNRGAYHGDNSHGFINSNTRGIDLNRGRGGHMYRGRGRNIDSGAPGSETQNRYTSSTRGTRGSFNSQLHRGRDRGRGRGRGPSTHPMTGVNVGLTGQGSSPISPETSRPSGQQPLDARARREREGQVQPRIVSNNWSTQPLM